MGISIVLLAYQEEENLKVLFPKIKENISLCDNDYEVIVVDTMVPMDNTKSVCSAFGARYINQELPGFGGHCAQA